MTMSPSAPGVSPPAVSATERWRRVPFGWRIVMIVLILVVGVELASSTVTGVSSGGNGASGPSSSYDSSAAGTGALAQLLSQRGHRVDRLTAPLGGAVLPPRSALFVFDPVSWNRSDTRALAAALAAGDRVILGGPFPAKGVLRSLLGVAAAPRWRPRPAGTTHPVGNPPEVTSVQTVVASGGGTYASSSVGTGPAVPLLRGPGGILALISRERGTLVLLASSSPLHNGSLGLDDNAAFALDLVGPGTPVVIDEYDHGFGHPGTGLAGLPASWRWGLGLLLLAIFVWVLSAARRFGPPDPPERITVPPRVGYVDAMATLISTRPPHQLIEAAAPVYREARRRLCRRLGVPPESTDEVLAERLVHGWDATTMSEEVAGAVLRRPHAADDVVAVGRALSELEREGSNR